VRDNFRLGQLLAMVLIILSLVAALIARSPLIALRHPPFLPAQFLLFFTPIARFIMS
jgi:hypothetical protein